MKIKLLSLVAAAALLFSCGTSTSTTTATSTSEHSAMGIPAGIQNSFAAQYPDATNVTWSTYDATTLPIDWELTDWPALANDDYVVTFDMGGNQYFAWYDNEGTWVGSTYTVADHASLPSAVSAFIKSQYPGYTLEKVQRELWKDRLAYELKLSSGENKVKLLIGDDGTVLKQKMKD